jgi:diguanylate cyclase (GGDEF)-like protein/PAS domain S-box-containing protein
MNGEKMNGQPLWRPPVNATGIILHGGLQPPLAQAAVKAVEMAAWSGTAEELLVSEMLPSGSENVIDLLRNLTGAEDALVVNNVQAASLLVLHTVVQNAGRSQQIIVCGEEVFPDEFSPSLFNVLGCSGVCLKRVDKAAIPKDYRDVVGDDVAFILSSDREDDSFAGARADAELAGLGRERDISIVKMLGHATLVDLTPFGLAGRLRIQDFVAAGFDVVVFRGDRFLGGPPVGVVVGRHRYLSKLRRAPLAAAVRADKMAVAAFEATLEQYLDQETALQTIPLLRAIAAPVAGIGQRAERLAGELNASLGGLYRVQVTAGETLLADRNPGLGTLPSFRVEISCARLSGRQLAALLAKGDPPVVARISKEGILLDLRSVPEEDDEALLGSLIASLSGGREREMQVLDTVANPIWVLDYRGAFVFANKAGVGLWRTENEHLLGRKIEDVIGPKAAVAIRESLNSVLNTGEETSIEIRIEGPAGEDRWLDIKLAPGFTDQGKVGRVTFSANDVTGRKRTEEELKHSSMHDPLTGLYNRAYFEEEMRRLDTDRHYPMSFVVCNVDELKLINDTLGHDKGDELLRIAAATIKKPFCISDVVARIGGDEFAVVLPKTDEQTAREVCERIEKAVEEYNRTKSGLPLSLSVGFATGTEPSQGIQAVYKRAGDNMYESKLRRSGLSEGKVVDFFLNLLAKKGVVDEGHAVRLQRIVQLLGRTLGLSPEGIKSLLLLSKVYDVGKVGIDEAIILKDGTLSSKEWEEIKRHSEVGSRIVRFSPETAILADYVLQHHEWWDGSGYPQGLKGKDIHLYARILAIADAYQAMTSPRPYRRPLSHEEALAELKRRGGTQFDPRLVDIFVSLFNQEYLM